MLNVSKITRIVFLVIIFFTNSMADSICGDLHKKQFQELSGLSSYLDKVGKNEIAFHDFSKYRNNLFPLGFRSGYYWSIPNKFESYINDDNYGYFFIPKATTGISLYNNSMSNYKIYKDNYPSYEIYTKLNGIFSIDDILSALKNKMPNLFKKNNYKFWNSMNGGKGADTIVLNNSATHSIIFKYHSKVLSLTPKIKIVATFEQQNDSGVVT